MVVCPCSPLFEMVCLCCFFLVFIATVKPIAGLDQQYPSVSDMRARLDSPVKKPSSVASSTADFGGRPAVLGRHTTDTLSSTSAVFSPLTKFFIHFLELPVMLTRICFVLYAVHLLPRHLFLQFQAQLQIVMRCRCAYSLSSVETDCFLTY